MRPRGKGGLCLAAPAAPAAGPAAMRAAAAAPPRAAEAARARLCEMFATDVLQAWTFTVAPRQVGKTETTMLALGALVAAGAYLDLLFMHETRDTVMKDIADMVAAAQRCDPALEW